MSKRVKMANLLFQYKLPIKSEIIVFMDVEFEEI